MKQNPQLLELALQITKLKTLVAKHDERINFLWAGGRSNAPKENIAVRKIRHSTLETVKEHRDVLQAFAKGLANNYNPNIDGEDMWTAYEFADGSYADINVWLAGGSLVCISAYPVDDEGNINSSQWVRIYQESLPRRITNGKFNK